MVAIPAMYETICEHLASGSLLFAAKGEQSADEWKVSGFVRSKVGAERLAFNGKEKETKQKEQAQMCDAAAGLHIFQGHSN